MSIDSRGVIRRHARLKRANRSTNDLANTTSSDLPADGWHGVPGLNILRAQVSGNAACWKQDIRCAQTSVHGAPGACATTAHGAHGGCVHDDPRQAIGRADREQKYGALSGTRAPHTGRFDMRPVVSTLFVTALLTLGSTSWLAAQKGEGGPAADEGEIAFQAQSKTYKTRIDSTIRYSNFNDHVRRPWREAEIRGELEIDSVDAVFARVETIERFDIRDSFVELGYRRSFDKYGYALISVGGATRATLRPRLQLKAAAGGQLHQSSGMIGSTFWRVNAAFSRYAAGDTWEFNPGIEQYFWNDRVWINATWVNSFDQDGVWGKGWKASANWQITDQVRAVIGGGKGYEVDAGKVVRADHLRAGIAYDFNDSTSLRFDVAREFRNSYRRSTVSATLTIRF